MSEYFIDVFCILFVAGALSLLCFDSGKAEKTAIGIITAFVILSPIITALKEVDIDRALDSFVDQGYETDVSPSFVAEEAFAEGIKEAVAEKFSVNKENISVKVVDFDMKNMNAKEIVIFLSGTAVSSDYRGIKSYVNQLGLGECRVEIQLGGAS